VHKSEQGRDLLPGEHLVDKGYTDAHVLVESQQDYGVTIVGPVASDPSWQARAGEGFDKGSFVVEWERQVVTYPAGKESISWLPNSVIRLDAWWAGEPASQTRCSRSAALEQAD